MLIKGEKKHTIWISEKGIVQTFDQRFFPHEIKIFDLKSSDDAFYAIKEMVVRGAPLIGVTAAFGVYLASLEENNIDYIKNKAAYLRTSRPTAVNLMWALDKMLENLDNVIDFQIETLKRAQEIKQIEIDTCFQIGQFGLPLLEEISKRKNGETINILTHCNAGWIACIDWGTVTSPIYQAHAKGLKVHVWVDETRPRNQGANLTAFELGEQGVPHTLIVDNAGGHLMQHGMVDICIVGTDRTTRQGDVANKIGTYLKALAANDNNVPFYVALPSSTIDWSIKDGLKEIPIEERNQDEVRYIQGFKDGKPTSVLLCPETTNASNYGFDVTPAKYITGLITERGVCTATEKGMLELFPENK